jgi:beta-mannosidase
MRGATWSLASTAPSEVADPWQLDGLELAWTEAIVPGTVAQALRAAGQWDFNQVGDLDARDWWYRCFFEADDAAEFLRFDGLASVAEVWLNGERVLESQNMFEQYRVDVRAHLRARNELVLCFRSLAAAVAQKRPRPRWKTRLVRQQNLRWFRTTLLGRIPGWTPPVAPVGPWRPIVLEPRELITALEVRPSVHGTAGVVDVSFNAVHSDIVRGKVIVGDVAVELQRDDDRMMAQVRIDGVALWWPHTHGSPTLYACAIELDSANGSHTIDCGRIGFRTLEVRQEYGDFQVVVNGVPLFCRGACWTTSDIVSLGVEPQALRRLRDAGGNMVRIGGTMVYEEDSFYDLCDELGILVWQDFQFANMDYPSDDAFLDVVRREVEQQIRRLRRHPSVVVYCGNSEVEQQAAMLGMPREVWRSPLFGEILPRLCAELHSGTAYVPSTPSGGPLPFHTGTGITHYYGVGAYKRPLSDVRRANVRFASECLGFSNVPEQSVVDEVMENEAFAAHDPRWKRRVPRDSGSGWDFEDVRDHYLREFFSIDAIALRSADPARYLALSRVVTGEAMTRVYSEWRSAHSTCRGGLIWFLRDLWPGAGWGILDSRGAPKACWSSLRRVWQPRTVVWTDEGLDGLVAHVINETAEPFASTLELSLVRDGHIVTARATTALEIAPRSTGSFSADALLSAFHDTAYAYRFGPPKHDVAVATLLDGSGATLADAFHFPLPVEPQRAVGATVQAEARVMGDDQWELTLSSDRFLYAVHVDSAQAEPSDDYFHLMPGRAKTVTMTRKAAGKLAGVVEALNLDEAVRIRVTG